MLSVDAVAADNKNHCAAEVPVATTAARVWRAEVKSEFANYWPVVLGGAVCFGVGFAAFGFVSSLFLPKLSKEFGWSYAAISASAIGYLLASLILPAIGMLIDRIGARMIVVTSYVLLTGGYVAMTFIDERLWLYYTVLFTTLCFGAATGPMAFARAVAARFEAGRGLALALVLAGAVIVSMPLVPLVSHVVETWGWRAAFWVLAALAMVVGAPVSAMVLSTRPRAASNGAAEPSAPDGILFGEAMRQPRFWFLFAGIFFTGLPCAGFAGHASPLLMEKGFSPAAAALGISLLSFSVLFGRLVTGALIDHYWAPLVAAVILSFAALGACLLALHGLPVWLTLAGILLLGTALGAELDLLSYATAKYFGMRNYGAIYSVGYIGVCAAIPTGAIIAGAVHDRFGNYAPSLWIGMVSLLAGAALYLRLGPYPQREVA
jgi:MFS transporter, OFA family, oxalate/formate antiporter